MMLKDQEIVKHFREDGILERIIYSIKLVHVAMKNGSKKTNIPTVVTRISKFK